jgi:hypothetical protein
VLLAQPELGPQVQPELRVLLDLLEQLEQLAQELPEPQVLVAQQVSRVILEQLALLD